jgi:hypothetical protein
MKRFFDKIDMTDSCWLWKAGLRQGYGSFKINKKTISAHRFSYQIHKGEIPEGVFVCHSCDIRNCVNPNHLFLGSPKDNWKDGFDKGRIKLLGGIDANKLKKHPSKGAYNRGCRCNECKAIQNMMVKRYRDRLK